MCTPCCLGPPYLSSASRGEPPPRQGPGGKRAVPSLTLLPATPVHRPGLRAQEFAAKANEVCSKAGGEELVAAFPRVQPAGAPYLCADLTYAAQLLVAGFKLAPAAQITLVKQIQYNGQAIEAAWPLGAAVNDLSLAASH